METLDVFSAFRKDQYKEFFTEFERVISRNNPTIAYRLALESVHYIGIEVKAIFDDTEQTIDFVSRHFRNLPPERPPGPEEMHLGNEVDHLAAGVEDLDLNVDRLRKDNDYFTRDEERIAMFDSIEEAGNTIPLIAVLALQTFLCITDDQVRLNNCQNADRFRDFLRKWRNSFKCGTYKESTRRVLRALGGRVFKCMKVPLFVDNYGEKKCYEENELEIGEIHQELEIFHDTHLEESNQIQRGRAFRPSDNKNGIPGVWFGSGAGRPSHYGSHRFKTTLARLGVTGIRQGEIVKYKNEINVILYAHNDVDGGVFEFRKPITNVVAPDNRNAYVHISIFIPDFFFLGDNAPIVTEEDHSNVPHRGICVKEKRTGIKCNELEI